MWEGIYARADAAMVERVRSAEAQLEGRSPCQEGCAACCSKPAMVEACELPSLVEALRELETNVLARVRHRLNTWVAERRAMGFRGAPRSDARVRRQGKLLDNARLPCPLLEHDRCLIYARRPLSCRLHAIVGDAASCASPRAWVHTVRVGDILENALENATAYDPPRESDCRVLQEWLRVAFATLDGEGQ